MCNFLHEEERRQFSLISAICRKFEEGRGLRAYAKLLETRNAVLHAWLNIADFLDLQGEAILAGDVRHFARHLPRVLTDREHVAAALVAHFQQRRTTENNAGIHAR